MSKSYLFIEAYELVKKVKFRLLSIQFHGFPCKIVPFNPATFLQISCQLHLSICLFVYVWMICPFPCLHVSHILSRSPFAVHKRSGGGSITSLSQRMDMLPVDSQFAIYICLNVQREDIAYRWTPLWRECPNDWPTNAKLIACPKVFPFHFSFHLLSSSFFFVSLHYAAVSISRYFLYFIFSEKLFLSLVIFEV